MDEGTLLEPFHVHVTEGARHGNAPQLWVSKHGRALAANCNSRISEEYLRKLVCLSEDNAELIIEAWVQFFDGIYYNC